MNERQISLTLFGQEFSLYSDAPDEEVEQTMALLRTELEQTGLSLNGVAVPSSTMLVLGGLRLAARCVSLEKELGVFQVERNLDAERNLLISNMIETIATALKG
jgi:hypothetical protein